nr:hypothetical protein [Tanacetum cinerariifolium]
MDLMSILSKSSGKVYHSLAQALNSAIAVELTPTLNLEAGVVKGALFQSGMFALGVSFMCEESRDDIGLSGDGSGDGGVGAEAYSMMSTFAVADIDVCGRMDILAVRRLGDGTGVVIFSHQIEMDSIIPLGQKNTLAEYMILFGAENRLPMLDKDLYDSWKSRMELYMKNQEHGRMRLESVEHSPLIWPTIGENRVIRTKIYVELSAAKKIQAGYDMKATNIILQGFATPMFSPGDDSIACLNKAMAFLIVVASSRFSSTNNQLRTSSNLRNHATIQDDQRVPEVQAVQTIIPNNAAFQTKDLDISDSDCDDI